MSEEESESLYDNNKSLVSLGPDKIIYSTGPNGLRLGLVNS